MDRDGNGTLDFHELATGLTVFCAGSTDAKVRAAFDLYDIDGSGFIDVSEMERYLKSVFRLMYEMHPGFSAANGVSADDLAVATAAKAFEECDTNHDGQLSFDEFKLWYSGHN